MTNLLSLSAELLVLIFSSSPTIQADDVQNAPIIRDEWDWVRNVLETAMMDKLKGNNDLEGFMFDDRRAPGYYRQY
jgi:hypothetical protein